MNYNRKTSNLNQLEIYQIKKMKKKKKVQIRQNENIHSTLAYHLFTLKLPIILGKKINVLQNLKPPAIVRNVAY